MATSLELKIHDPSLACLICWLADIEGSHHECQKTLLVTGPDNKILQVTGPAGQSNGLSSALVLALTSFHSSFYFYCFSAYFA